jgi:hypothetical protein
MNAFLLILKRAGRLLVYSQDCWAPGGEVRCGGGSRARWYHTSHFRYGMLSVAFVPELYTTLALYGTCTVPTCIYTVLFFSSGFGPRYAPVRCAHSSFKVH